MAKGAGGKLVNSIVRRIEAKAAYQKQQMPAANVTAVPPAPAATGGRSPDTRSRSNNGSGSQFNRGSNNGRRHVHVAAAARA
jgi:hypothetical protein